MKYPKIKDLKIESQRWSYKDLKWIRTIVYNLNIDPTSQTGEIDMDKAPQWFINFETKNDLRWEKQENFNSEMFEFKTNQENFNFEIKSSIQGINNRIDNLVIKNQLTE